MRLALVTSPTAVPACEEIVLHLLILHLMNADGLHSIFRVPCRLHGDDGRFSRGALDGRLLSVVVFVTRGCYPAPGLPPAPPSGSATVLARHGTAEALRLLRR